MVACVGIERNVNRPKQLHQVPVSVEPCCFCQAFPVVGLLDEGQGCAVDLLNAEHGYVL
jgi:hypothetical protein